MKNTQVTKIDGLHVSYWEPEEVRHWVLYVHGGPGYHSAWFEAVLKNLAPYHESKIGWICYDQRGCGRSRESGEKPVTHETNLRDLKTIIDALGRLKLIQPLKGVVGHSYGASLAFDLFKENPDIEKKLILLGRSRKMETSLHRTTVMDLLTLKQNQPDEYQRAVSIIEETGKIDYMTPLRIRELVIDRDQNRLAYYWGNLSAMQWYNDLKRSISFGPNLKVMDSVLASVLSEDLLSKVSDPAELKQKVLWINGFHDFLMGGDLDLTEKNGIEVYLRSGHYPHIEEPERFLHDLETFLSSEK